MFKNFVYPNDLQRAPKKVLQDMAIELGLASDITSNELLASIWEKRLDSKYEEVLGNNKESLFAHRGSYITYKIKNGEIDKFFEDHLKEYLNNKRIIPSSEITSEPQLISSVELNDQEILFKVTMKVKNENRIVNDDVETVAIINQVNVLIDKTNNMVEIRTQYDQAQKIISFIGGLYEEFEFELVKIDLNDLIEKLNATMISSKGYTNIDQITLNKQSKDAIVNIVKYIDNHLNVDEIEPDVSILKQQIDILKEEEEVDNFVLLLISGLGKLDLASIFDSETTEDLTSNSLYGMIEPYVEKDSCFLSVPYLNGAVNEKYTIKISIEKNIVTFSSTPNEGLIRHVRSNLI